VTHKEALEPGGVPPQLGQDGPGERQVPGLFQSVIATDVTDERVGTGMLAEALLDEIGSLPR
jgi:hypothetical protein